MKIRLLLIGLALTVNVSMLAQQTTHRVGRGETIVTIAQKYGVSIAELINLNPSLKNGAHYGATLVIPDKSTGSASSSTQATVSSSTSSSKRIATTSSMSGASAKAADNAPALYSDYFSKAEKAYSKRQYGRAKRLYAKADAVIPSAVAKYNIGICHYKLENWRKAQKAFSAAEYASNATDSLKEDADNMYKACGQQLSARRERRKQTWAAIGTGVAVAGAAVATGYMASQMSQSSYSSSPYYSGSVSAYSSDLDYAIAAHQADAQARQSMAMANNQRVAIARQNAQQATIDLNNYTQASVTAINTVNAVFPNWYWSYQQSPTINPDASFRDAFFKAHGRYPNAMEMDLFHSSFAGMNSEGGSDIASDPSDASDVSDSLENTTTLSGNYEQDYRDLERRVIEEFKSWTTIGGNSYKENDGTTHVSIDSSNVGGTNLSMYALILRNQKEMRRIREEASRNGVHISKSEWEFKSVSYY